MKYITLVLALLMGFGGISHSAMADQKSKNDWRNATIGAGAITGYGLLSHNKTLTILGAAGTAYSANRYETDRHNQSVEHSRRDRRWEWQRDQRQREERLRIERERQRLEWQRHHDRDNHHDYHR